MFVEMIMKREIISIYPHHTINEALTLLKINNIGHLPIVNEDNQLIGIISDRDIRDAAPSIFEKKELHHQLEKPVSTIMKTDIITAHPLDFVEELSAVFLKNKIGCIPIVEQTKLVGIVTETDMLHTLIHLTGAHQPSSQIEVKVENIAGMLAKVTSIIGKRKVNIASVLVYPGNDEAYKILVFRIQTMNPTAIIQDLQKEGYHVLSPNGPGGDK
ncbi:acetoin utilization AcuB family protein [Bacillus taeanensis]|uniref:Acetoin utilization protein AcuB n=1 Tax=Bacillus taeanensis TaxID=273032 RepID=A0A366Y0S8_9BACI|nr:acetoin utilization AcuB family protein [Bacillus taeanensis]RBW71448.1 acetoin utilization protein AcuB [Bacillus taeanensis]